MLDGYIGTFGLFINIFFTVAKTKPALLAVTLYCIYTLAELRSRNYVCTLQVGLDLDKPVQVCVAFKWC